ncbi:MAG: hypothetical protein ACSLFO_01235 [Acidimicrobiales bacterium]
MSIFRRSSPRASDLHAVGLQAAVGLKACVENSGPSSKPLGITCGTCGATGRIDMIDMTERRAYVTCPSCARTWDTDRNAVPRQPFFASLR